MALEPAGRLPSRRPDPDQILDATATGQTRYVELRDNLNVSEPELDRALMKLAKQGDVSLVAVGDVLSVQSHHSHGESS